MFDKLFLPQFLFELDEQQLDSLQNTLFIIWILMYFSQVKYHHFIFVILFVIYYIKNYYIHKRVMIETYCPPLKTSQAQPLPKTTTLPLEQWNILPKDNSLRIQKPEKNRFCNDAISLNFDKSFKSKNQELVGKANPKTLEPVPVVAPPTAWDYWSDSTAIPQGINKQAYFDMVNSGYISLDPVQENVHQSNCFIESYVTPKHTNSNTVPNTTPVSVPNTTPVSVPNVSVPPKYWINEKGTPGDFIPWSYNPQQTLEHHIPSNLPVGQCTVNNTFNDYNQNLYTGMIQPGMYYQTQVAEPVQSNIGITFQQQLQPVQRYESQDGTVTFVNQNPRFIPNQPIQPPLPERPTQSNVYDPRTYGYGTSYRCYVDPFIGQPRFMYDDVDAIRKPNYIIRSNIDHIPCAPSYGPYEPESDTYLRETVHDKYLQDTLSQREELQQRYMRKYNNQVGWQRRQAPIHTRNTKS